MATIDDEQTVARLIAANGHYEDDPPVLSITRYRTIWGGWAYGLVYPPDRPDRYAASHTVMDAEVIFRHQAHPGCDPQPWTPQERAEAAARMQEWLTVLGAQVITFNVPLTNQDQEVPHAHDAS